MLHKHPKIFGNGNCAHFHGSSLITIRKHGGHSSQATQSTHSADGADSQKAEGEVIHPRSLYQLAELELQGENPKMQKSCNRAGATGFGNREMVGNHEKNSVMIGVG